MSTSPSNRKGQTAIEFLATVIMLLLVFTAVYGTVVKRQVQMVERQVQMQAQSLAERVAYELDLALTEGEGYRRTFRLQNQIGNYDYRINVTNGTVIVTWGEETVFATTAATNVSGNIASGANTIYNTGNVIRVE
ncbi:MAG: hypothetical protein SVU32_01350 [Candidatus Nanohaloarchaea archaeon]|nr:hypothetical protein [Candidatus Nanohaloarchaea archaeon]